MLTTTDSIKKYVYLLHKVGTFYKPTFLKGIFLVLVLTIKLNLATKK